MSQKQQNPQNLQKPMTKLQRMTIKVNNNKRKREEEDDPFTKKLKVMKRQFGVMDADVFETTQPGFRYFCNVCQAGINTEKDWDNHVIGKKHKKKLVSNKLVIFDPNGGPIGGANRLIMFQFQKSINPCQSQRWVKLRVISVKQACHKEIGIIT
eukprot:UN23981